MKPAKNLTVLELAEKSGQTPETIISLVQDKQLRPIRRLADGGMEFGPEALLHFAKTPVERARRADFGIAAKFERR